MKKLLYSLLLIGTLASCAEEVDPTLQTTRFSRVYDDGIIGDAFAPLDVIELADSGFLVLSTLNEQGIHLMKTDKEGRFLWDRPVQTPYAYALPGLISDGSDVYFFCMDEVSLQAQLLRVDTSGNNPEPFRSYPDILYPLAAAQTASGSVLLHSYDRDIRNSRLDHLNSTFMQTWSENYPVLDDVEEAIIGHLTGTGERLPFFAGERNGGYYFNGFNNYSLSLTFVDAVGAETGLMSGFREESGINAAAYLETQGNYALCRFNNDDNYLLPATGLATGEETLSDEAGGRELPEIDPSKPVKVLVDDREDGNPATIYAATTRSGRIVLLAYEGGTGNLVGTRYLGNEYAYELSAIRTTTLDDGLIIAGTTRVAGRYPRICLFKLNAQDMRDLLGY